MIVELAYIRSRDAEAVGRTAARLGERLRNGVEVAPGFVVTTDDLAGLARREGLAARIEGRPAEEAAAVAAEAVDAAELPADLVEDLTESYAALGRDAWVTVQPSPAERDLGVSRDVLGPVRGVDEVWALIRRVWGSLWAPEAVVRRADKGVDDPQDKLAVLVQRAEAPAEDTESAGKAGETAPGAAPAGPAGPPAKGTRAAEPAREAAADEEDQTTAEPEAALAETEEEAAGEEAAEAEPAAEPVAEAIGTETVGESASRGGPAAEAAGQAGPSQARAHGPGNESASGASAGPSGRPRWVVIGLVSFVLLLVVRHLRRR
ncbi:PEP/pyruvate-binding domain-containing protein [uncultured Propionibacterium sp.]|uniref:PEP/pyruvate-binding domain-containing protein n=1 Tax=uncultured Propionibacterium sp. TaxID=218066 RepID=UPI00292F0DD0|nr:PEP/pyruvate-binding domain-containing protein [uncultured Propionibacterium sp.]